MNKKFTKDMVNDYADKLLIGLTDEECNMVLDEFSVIDETINKIKDIKWSSELNDEDYSMNEKMYIVAGSDQYIEEMNQSIIEYYKNKDCKVKIINCFDICADKEKHNLIIDKNYVSTLTTRGESAIS